MYETLQSWVDTPWGITSLDQIPGIGDESIAIPATRKGFPVNILTGPYGSCSNGGLASRVRGVVIVEIDGDDVPDFARLTEPRQDAPAVSLRSE
ncbi:hypothetical protein AB0I53_19420 [Saccharopolyspora sp. NPDC050389]|uniref:hypothetical protein n=1 Tax=Saccharopolyspora sp. NPDC050389 TaxID=3155516 RepID=UPI0033E938ED